MRKYVFIVLVFICALFYSNVCYGAGCNIEHEYIVIEMPTVVEVDEEELKKGVTFDDKIKVYYKDGSDLINYEKGKSYTVTYENNTSVGTGYITFKGKVTREEHDKNPFNYDFYTDLYGSVTKTFTIKLKKASEKYDLTSEKVIITIPEFVTISGGNGTEASVSIEVEGIELARGTDYSLEFKNNYNIGTASVKIKALNGSKYIKGEITKEFLIVNENYFDVTENPDYYIDINVDPEPMITKRFSIILSTIQVIGVIVSVITLMIIGVKYIFGSIEQRAEYKQTLIPWLLGAILVFAATTIPKMIYELVSKW